MFHVDGPQMLRTECFLKIIFLRILIRHLLVFHELLGYQAPSCLGTLAKLSERVFGSLTIVGLICPSYWALKGMYPDKTTSSM